MKSSETSNPYDALATSVPASAARDELPPWLVLLPTALVLALAALALSVLWRKRRVIGELFDRRLFGAAFAAEVVTAFLWYTDNLTSEAAIKYAVGAPIAIVLLRTAWRVSRPNP